MIHMSLTGDKALERKLQKLPAKMQRNLARKAMRKGLADMRKEARSLAPKRTGRLRKAIKTRVSLRSSGDMTGRVFIKTKGKAGAPYAHLVEWGTDLGGLTAYRFMTRAFETGQRDFLENFRRVLKLEIQKAGKK